MKKQLPFPLDFKSYEENTIPLVHPITFSKNHIPFHKNVLINTQEEYDNYLAMLQYLNNQVGLGFKPKWMVTYHLKHPREFLKPLKETNNQFGHRDTYGYKYSSHLWNQVGYDNYMLNRRNDYDLVSKENNHIKNLINKYLYGIKRFNRKDKIPNMMFFIEKGRVKLQYHIHLLLTGQNCLFNDIIDIEDTLNSSILLRAKSLSKTKHIHCTKVDTPIKVLSYLNKETKGKHLSLDTQSSVLLKKTNETTHRI